MRTTLPWIVGALLLSALFAAAGRAQAPPAADVADGMRLYLQKGDCQSCHGWAADGRKMDSQMPDGSNLRETRLDRARLIMTVKCGRPGTGMPAFDKFAYTDGRCGLKAADLKTPMTDPPATFQPREIDLVVEHIDVAHRDFEEALRLADRAPALVHEGRRLQQHDAIAAEAQLRRLALKAPAPRAGVVARSNTVDRHEADVVAMARVFLARVAQSDEELHGNAPRGDAWARSSAERAHG